MVLGRGSRMEMKTEAGGYISLGVCNHAQVKVASKRKEAASGKC